MYVGTGRSGAHRPSLIQAPSGETENELRIVVGSFALPAATLPAQILYTGRLNERARHGDSWVCSNPPSARHAIRSGMVGDRGDNAHAVCTCDCAG